MGTSQDAYESFCDELWRDWLADRLARSAFVGGDFDSERAPEPWLELRAGLQPLVALTTNPGGGMKHQLRDEILRGRSVITPTDSYRAATAGLPHFYETYPTLAGSAARRRITALLRLSELAGYDGVLQVESCPFHSARLPNKPALVRASKGNGLLGTYMEHLRQFLKRRPVVSVSAVSSRAPLSREHVLSEWLVWQATLMGLEPGRARFVPLVKKEGDGTTAAALVSSVRGIPRALVLMMGGNHLPAERGLAKLAIELKATAGARAG